MFSNDNRSRMIELKPEPEILLTCPACRTEGSALKEILIQSAFVMADCTCGTCGLDFYQTLPVGHAVNDTLSIVKSDGRLYSSGATKTWLSEAVLKAHRFAKQDEVAIRKIIFTTHEHVVVLNTLDYLYGHTLLKLYNSIYHLDHHGDLGLIVIIP